MFGESDYKIEPKNIVAQRTGNYKCQQMTAAKNVARTSHLQI